MTTSQPLQQDVPMQTQRNNELARRINLPLLTLYGLGTILGAGIYVLVGKIAGSSGMLAPLAFIVAGVIAGVTALSYAQLVVLFPKSAGEVIYVQKGLRLDWLAVLVGLLVILMGIVSCATLANGFVGYLNVFIATPKWLAILVVVSGFGALAMWGISESLWVSALMTCAEIAGLCLIIWVRGDSLAATIPNSADLFIPNNWAEISAVMAGAFLAFYAFIGFEDMVNIVEEVKSPAKTMPRAILAALIGATALYVIIALIAVQSLPLQELSHSDAPLALLMKSGGESNSENLSYIIAAISLVAIINGILVQIIMASRVLYGMAAQGKVPDLFAAVNSRTATPLVATGFVTAIVLIASLWLPLVTLAKATSYTVLVVFTLVNVSLWRVKQTGDYQLPHQLPNFPFTGALLCVALLIFQLMA